MRKLLTYLSIVLLLFQVPLTTVSASQIETPSITSDGIQYIDNGNGTATVTGYTGEGSKVVIPKSVNGLTVTNIGDEAFEGSTITEVEVKGDIDKVGFMAFANHDLQKVLFEGNVGVFGDKSFETGGNIETFQVQGNVGEIGELAFSSNRVTDFKVEGSIGTVGHMSFGNSTIGNMKIGAITEVQHSAFYKTKLNNLTVNDGITNIGSSAFSEAEITKMDVFKNTKVVEGSAFSRVKTTSDITISKSWETLGTQVFMDAEVGKVTIEDGVSQIPQEMFDGSNVTELHVPSSVKTIEVRAFADSKIGKLTIEEGVTTLKQEAFEDNNLVCVTVPKSVTSIEEGVFAGNNENFTIYGALGSEAQKYADREGYPFQEGTGSSDCNTEEWFVTINHVDEEGAVLGTEIVKDLTVGEFTAQAKEFEGYTLVGEGEKSVNITHPGHNPEITFTYKTAQAYVKVNYVDEDNESIHEPDLFTYNLAEGNTYKVEPRDITYYEKVDVFGKEEGTLTAEETIEVTYTYNATIGTLIVEYVDTNGNELKDMELSTHVLIENDEYVTEPADIEGYQLVSIDGDKEGKLIEGTTLVTYVYEEIGEDGGEEEEGVSGDFRYEDNEDGTTTIVEYLGEDTKVVIPQTINGLIVTVIGDRAFEEMEIEHVEFPDTIEEIGNYAFAGNRLVTVELPENLTVLGEFSFAGNEIEELTINDKIKKLDGERSFYLNKIKVLNIPSNVVEIGDEVFANNEIVELTLEEGVEKIGYMSFVQTKEVEKLTIPTSLQHIGRGAFQNSKIKELEIPGDIELIDENAFYNNIFEKVTVQGNVGEIGRHAFMEFDTDEEVESEYIFEGNIDFIGGHAFQGLNNASRIYIGGDIGVIDEFGFISVTADKITIEGNIDNIGYMAFGYSEVADDIYIKGNVGSIEGYVFSQSDIKNIKIDGDVGILGEWITSSIKPIKSFYVGGSVGMIDEYAFNRVELEDFTVEGNVNTIREGAFQDGEIDNFYIGGGVERVGTAAFYHAKSKSIVVAEGVTHHGVRAFHMVESGNLKIFEGTETHDEMAFAGIKTQEDITISAKWIDMGARGFTGSEIGNLVIEDGVVSIPEYYFFNSNVKKVDFPESIRKLEDNSFSNTHLEKVKLNDGLEELGDKVFENNNLTCITIPGSVTSIGEEVFEGNQKNNEDFTIFGQLGSEAERYANSEGYTFIEDTIENNTCDPTDWFATINHVTEDGKELDSIIEEKPDLGEYIAKALELDDYVVVGEDTQTVTITNDDHSPVIEFKYRLAEGTIITHYVDEDGEKITDSETTVYYLKDTKEYAVTPKDIDYYELIEVNGEEEGTLVTEGTIEVTYVYKATEGSLQVNYVDEEGNKLFDSQTTVYQLKDTTKYSATKQDIEHYSLVEVIGEEEGNLIEGDTIEVTYVYKAAEGSVEVNYVDEDGKDLLDQETTIYLIKDGTKYSTTAKDIPYYKLLEVQGEEAGTIVEGKTTVVTYVYQPKESTVKVKYEDEEGNTINEPQTIVYQLKDDEEYITQSKDIKYYELVNIIGNETGTLVEGEIVEVTYVYKALEGTVEVNYVDEKGNNLSTKETTVYQLKDNEEYKTTAKEIDNYKVIEIIGEQEGKLVAGEVIEVTYVYGATEGTVTVNYVDEDGKVLSDPKTTVYLMKDEDTYTTVAKAIPYYNLVEVIGEETGDLVEEEVIEVTYVYKAKEGTVEINYVDEKGNPIDKQQTIVYQLKEGTSYTTEAKEYKHYELVNTIGDETGTIKEGEVEVVTYIYKAVAGSVEVNYIDVDGNVISDQESTLYLLKDTSEYTTTAKEIPYYNVVEVLGDKNGTLVEGGVVEVTYVYKEVEGTVTVNYEDEAGQTIAKQQTTVYQLKNGTSYETKEKDIQHYELVEVKGEETGTLIEDKEVVVTYIYKAVEGSIKVNYEDEEGNTLLDPSTAVYKLKDTDNYTVTAKDIKYYELVEVVGKEKGNLVANDVVEVTYVYKATTGTVEVHYENVEGDSILESETIEFKLKDTTEYKTQAKGIEGYILSKVIGDEEGKLVENGKVEITYVYEEVLKEGTLVVRYEDEEGNSLSKSETTVYNLKDTTEYTTKEKSIEGYELITVEGNQTGLLIEDETVEVVYIYKKIEEENEKDDEEEDKEINATVKVSYEDTDGKELTEPSKIKYDLNEQTKYETTAKEIEGYEVVDVIGETTGDLVEDSCIEVVYIYQLIEEPGDTEDEEEEEEPKDIEDNEEDPKGTEDNEEEVEEDPKGTEDNDEESDEESKGKEDDDEEVTIVETSDAEEEIKETVEDEKKEGSPTPATATNTGNIILIGIMIMFTGIVLVYGTRFRRKNTN